MPTGAGGGGSKPSVAYVNGQSASNVALQASNTLWGESSVITCAVTFSKITINIGSTDAVNNYDFGFYTPAGVLVAHIGAQTLPTTGYQTFSIVGGAQTVQPGQYVFVFTGAATTATLGFFNQTYAQLSNRQFGSSSGGALPATFTPPTWSSEVVTWFFALS